MLNILEMPPNISLLLDDFCHDFSSVWVILKFALLPPDLICYFHISGLFWLQWFWVDSNGGSSSCGSDSGKRDWKRRRRTRRRKNDRARRQTTSRKLTPIATTSSIITQLRPTLITKPSTHSHLKSLLLRLNLATTPRPTLKGALMEMYCHRWDAAPSLFIHFIQFNLLKNI